MLCRDLEIRRTLDLTVRIEVSGSPSDFCPPTIERHTALALTDLAGHLSIERSHNPASRVPAIVRQFEMSNLKEANKLSLSETVGMRH